MNLHSIILFLITLNTLYNNYTIKILTIIFSGIPLYFKLTSWLRLPHVMIKIKYIIQFTLLNFLGEFGKNIIGYCAGLKRRNKFLRNFSTLVAGCALDGILKTICVMDDEYYLYYNDEDIPHNKLGDWEDTSEYITVIETLSQKIFYKRVEIEEDHLRIINYHYLIDINDIKDINRRIRGKLIVNEPNFIFIEYNLEAIMLKYKPNIFYDGLAHRLDYIERILHIMKYGRENKHDLASYNNLESVKPINVIDVFLSFFYIFINIPNFLFIICFYLFEFIIGNLLSKYSNLTLNYEEYKDELSNMGYYNFKKYNYGCYIVAGLIDNKYNHDSEFNLRE